MARILDGKQVATAVRAKLEAKVEELAKQSVRCGLAIVLVEGDPASKIYTNALVRLAESIGIRTLVEILPASVTEQELLALIDKLNNDETVHGILPMMPLPPHLSPDKIAENLFPAKDVDSINPLNVGLVASGKSSWAPCTPRAVMAILDYYGIELEGRQAVIIGRSNVVGKPLIQLLLARNATVTVCHSHTRNLAEVVRQGDIVIAAVGVPGLVGADIVKAGAVVIDVGINEVDGKIVGDVDFAAVSEFADAITPVPGGVGTVCNMMVMDAVLRRFI